MPTCSLQILPTKIRKKFLNFSKRTTSTAQLVFLEITPLHGEEHIYVLHENSLPFKKINIMKSCNIPLRRNM
jgi:hypothetical protein